MKRGSSLLSVMEQTVRSDGNYDAHTFVTDIHNDLHNETTTWFIKQIWCFRGIQNCLYFLPEFVATVLEVFSASKYFDNKYMEFAKIQVSFPREWQLSRHNSSGNVVMAWLQLLSNLISKPASSRCLESFNNRHHPPFHILVVSSIKFVFALSLGEDLRLGKSFESVSRYLR